MAINLKETTNNASVAALIGAVVAIVVSCLSIYSSSQNARQVQELQYRQQLITSLNTSSGKLVSEGGRLISAVNSAKALSEPKEDLKILVAQQTQEIESLKMPLSLSDADLQYYQDALIDFEHKTLAVRTSLDMPEWAVSFGHLLDVERVLSQRLQKQKI